MTKVEFDIPEKILNEEARKQIKKLEKKLLNAERREARCKQEKLRMEGKVKQADQVLQRFRELGEELKQLFGLYDDDYV